MQFTFLPVLLAACCIVAETPGLGDHQPSQTPGPPFSEISGSVTIQALTPTATVALISKAITTATSTEGDLVPSPTVSAVLAQQQWYMNPWFHVGVTFVITLVLFAWPIALIGMYAQRRRTCRLASRYVNQIPLSNIGRAV